jgi:hypothetical protein
MPVHTAGEIGTTFDCKTPGCANASRSRVGRYSYCDGCRERRASLSTAPPAPGPGARPLKAGSLEDTVKQLAAAAKNADKLAAHAKKLTERALAAKANADAAARGVSELARELMGGQE